MPFETDIVPNIDYNNDHDPFATSGQADWIGARFEGYLTFPSAGTFELEFGAGRSNITHDCPQKDLC